MDSVVHNDAREPAALRASVLGLSLGISVAGLQGFEPQLSDPESGDRLPAAPVCPYRMPTPIPSHPARYPSLPSWLGYGLGSKCVPPGVGKEGGVVMWPRIANAA